MTLDDALKEVAEGYPDAAIAAGIQLAWLEDKNGYYCAVHAFPAGVQTRKVVAKAVKATSGEAIAECLQIWRAIRTAETAVAS